MWHKQFSRKYWTFKNVHSGGKWEGIDRFLLDQISFFFLNKRDKAGLILNNWPSFAFSNRAVAVQICVLPDKKWVKRKWITLKCSLPSIFYTLPAVIIVTTILSVFHCIVFFTCCYTRGIWKLILELLCFGWCKNKWHTFVGVYESLICLLEIQGIFFVSLSV